MKTLISVVNPFELQSLTEEEELFNPYVTECSKLVRLEPERSGELNDELEN